MPTLDDFMPWDKSRIIRYSMLDVIHGHEQNALTWLEENYETLGDDLIALRRTIKQYIAGQDLDVGESGTLLRFWRWILWSQGDTRRIIRRGTLQSREICDDPSILKLNLVQLLELDKSTSQWASASVLWSKERFPGRLIPPHLHLTYIVLQEWQEARDAGYRWEARKDETITAQATAYIEWRETGEMHFKPEKGEDFCFAAIFGLITPEEGRIQWPALRGHESNRVVAMKEAQAAVAWSRWDGISHSRDHRVVQALAMRHGDSIKFTHPECVNKSWPQFWEFIAFCTHM